jgi:hypothetical protein
LNDRAGEIWIAAEAKLGEELAKLDMPKKRRTARKTSTRSPVGMPQK